MATTITTEAALKALLKKRADEAETTGLRPPRVAIPDRDVQGMVARISPANRCDFSVKYTVNNKSFRVTLGRYPEVTLDDARAKALAARSSAHEARKGLGEHAAVAARKAKKEALAAAGTTVEVIGAEYLRRHCIGDDPDNPRRRSAPAKESILRRLIYPRIGSRPIKEITRRDLITLLDEVRDENGPIMANRTLAEISMLFSWAIGRDLIDASPVVGIKRPGDEAPRNRVLSDAELRLIWSACDLITPPFGRYVRLLMLTGARRTEAAGLQWQEVDLAERRWTLPAARSKNKQAHVIPLSDLAAEMIGKPSTSNAVHVFRAPGDVPLSSCYDRIKIETDAAILALQKAPGGNAVELPGWVFHDCRRTLRTRLPSLGVTPDIGERVLGHVIGGIRGVYDLHSYEAEKRHALELWAARLAEIVGHLGKPAAKAAA